MKSSMFNVIVSVIVVTAIISSLMYSSSNVRPYSDNNIFGHQYPYEGFHTLEYLNNNQKVSDLTVNNNLINNANASDCKKIRGFNGLFCKPYVADSKIDIFSDVKGDPSCFGQSSGLSNSKGSLCLGNELTQMLQTRGGNQTGKPDQYGK